MKVYYQSGTNWSKTPSGLSNEPDLISLSYNNWDDFSFSTTLNAALYFGGEIVLEFSLKIAIKDEVFTAKKLNNLRANGWDGFFPIPDLDYISVPSEIDFYSALLAKIKTSEVVETLILIRDAGYLTQVKNDKKAFKLVEEEVFSSSVLREGGARKSYVNGWMLVEGKEESRINDFTLNTVKRNGEVQEIGFKFESGMLPYDINVLIGPNGIGKSYTLQSLIEYWLGVNSGSKTFLEKSGHQPFDEYPNISKLILISYSPFEEFHIDLANTELKNKSVYRYFGFRKLRGKNEDGSDNVGISRNLPARDSIFSLVKAFSDDEKFNFMPSWIGKVDVIKEVLNSAFKFDFLALEILDNAVFKMSLFKDDFLIINGRKYLPIDKSKLELLDDFGVDITEKVNQKRGVVFIRGDNVVSLSSGQRLFCYIVINVVGEIKKDSLIVIDEPELFLHPTLEIDFIGLLKKVLFEFSSKAILATHSLTIAREIPATCMHVFRENKIIDDLDVFKPPFETFGGDMQRISTYVFGDDLVKVKPFDEWLINKAKGVDDIDSLIKSFGKEINEEMMMTLLNQEVSIGS
jgi:ABC-type cobalamin/Fe3+-siderophores transport system ATPase subunit